MSRERILRLSLVLLTILIILLVWDGCVKRAELSAFQKEMSKFTLSEQKFTQTIDKQKGIIIEQDQLILSQKDAIRLNLIEIDKLKKIKSQVRVITDIRIDSVLVPYTDIDTIYINKDTFLVKKFALTDKYYSFFGKTQPNGVLLDSVSFKNDFNVTIANKPMGLFKKSKPIVEVVFENPYVQTKKVNNVVIKDELKWYHRRGTWFGVGIGLGIIGGLLIQ